ncbi:DUF805 domain-containing protein [Pseudomonas tolaasii]|uniref:DUF805 domain-containing protein n=1 Tax=Pseudomonas tolaasii TaxID=29442 RepID=UPI002732BA7D|nr:DUF805 domain-containing protein [Pseudomonas tolaasii]WLH53694.1 DUF805 domain-containing protein [Pseudomonas tolaasii]
MNWCFRALKNYAKFSGRANRKEYWLFAFVDIVLTYGSMVAAGWAGVAYSRWFYIPLGIYTVLMIIPRIAVTFRRLHDVNMTGAYVLWYALPLVGLVMVTIKLLTKGDQGENKYGLPCRQVENA